MAVSVALSADQTKAQVSESSCEKSCQVTSEQIKADMKAAVENSRRTSTKGIITEAGETAARPGPDSGTVRGTGIAGAAARTAVRPVTGCVGRIGPGAATSRQVGGCERVMTGTTHRATTTTDRATGTGRTNYCTEGPSGTQTGDSCTRDAGVRQSSGPVGVDSLDPRGATVNHAPRRPGERQPVPAGYASAAFSGSQQSQARGEEFVPRRPMTRSCTRMSFVSLVPETGNTKVTHSEHVSFVSTNHHFRLVQLKLVLLFICKGCCCGFMFVHNELSEGYPCEVSNNVARHVISQEWR